jgi:PAS domain S-box-containing protein
MTDARLASCEAFLEAAPLGIAVLDGDGHVRFANQALERMFGYDPGELIGQPLEVLVAEDIRELHATIRAAYMHAPTMRPLGQGMEQTGRHKHGQAFPVEIGLSYLGRADQIMPIAFVVDISARRRIEEENAQLLRQAQAAMRSKDEALALFDMAVQSAPFGFAFLDRAVRYQFINPQLAAMNGLPPEQHLGRTPGELFPPFGLHVEYLLRQVCDTGEPLLDIEFSGTPRGSSEALRHWLCSYYPVRGQDGALFGVGAMVLDITRWKRAEEALRRSEQLYRTLMRHFPNGSVLLVDHDLRITIADGQALDAHGFRRESMEGKLLSEVLPPEIYADREPLYRAALAGITQTREQLFGGATFMTYYVPVRNGNGDIFAAMAVSHDITERKRMEQALHEERALLAQRIEERTADLRAANMELARAARLKDEFLASMSHELRTPLNAVLGLSEALREQAYGPISERQDRALQTIEESGRHLLELINDILDLAKIDAGRMDMDMDDIEVEPICQMSMRMVRQAAQQKHITMELTIDPAATRVRADPRRLKQILVNLLSNAIKFTPGDGRVGLDVTTDAAQHAMHFTVWDTGIGIAPGQMERLFQPFVQLDSRLARRYDGTGLGLALVDRMVRLHGGSVAVTSEQGVGSRFRVSLPWHAGP